MKHIPKMLSYFAYHRRRGLGLEQLATGVMLLACIAGCTGCTELADGDDTYATLLSEGQPLEENWNCLDDPDLRRSAAPSGTAELTVVNLLDMGAVVDATVLACGRLDPNCASPVAIGVGEPPLHTVEVVAPFDGFYRITAPGYIDATRFADTDFTVNRLDGSIDTSPLHVMMTEADLTEIARDIGVPDSASALELSSFATPILDCNGVPGEGAELFIVGDQHPEAVAWSLRDGLPQRGATTGPAGVGGIFMVPVGTMTVCGRYRGREFGAVAVRMRNGELTTATVRAGLPCES